MPDATNFNAPRASAPVSLQRRPCSPKTMSIAATTSPIPIPSSMVSVRVVNALNIPLEMEGIIIWTTRECRDIATVTPPRIRPLTAPHTTLPMRFDRTEVPHWLPTTHVTRISAALVSTGCQSGELAADSHTVPTAVKIPPQTLAAKESVKCSRAGLRTICPTAETAMANTAATAPHAKVPLKRVTTKAQTPTKATLSPMVFRPGTPTNSAHPYDKIENATSSTNVTTSCFPVPAYSTTISTLSKIAHEADTCRADKRSTVSNRLFFPPLPLALPRPRRVFVRLFHFEARLFGVAARLLGAAARPLGVAPRLVEVEGLPLRATARPLGVAPRPLELEGVRPADLLLAPERGLPGRGGLRGNWLSRVSVMTASCHILHTVFQDANARFGRFGCVGRPGGFGRFGCVGKPGRFGRLGGFGPSACLLWDFLRRAAHSSLEIPRVHKWDADHSHWAHAGAIFNVICSRLATRCRANKAPGSNICRYERPSRRQALFGPTPVKSFPAFCSIVSRVRRPPSGK